MNYLNEKGKAFGVAIIYSLFFAVFSLALYIGRYLPGYSWIYGVALMLFAIPLALLGYKQKLLYILAIFLNAVGTGFIAAFYYVTYSIPLSVYDVLVPTAIGIAALILFSVLSHLVTEEQGVLFAVYAILLVALLVVVAILWGTSGSQFFSVLFFISVLLAISVVLLAVVVAGKEENELLRDASFASFGILIVVGIIVALLVGADGCDCDCGCDGCDCGGGSKKKKRTP